MQNQNEYTRTRPFDLYQIYLFYQVAITGSFTKAGLAVGLTQSAVTRQIALMESKLGVSLFSRNTRRVVLNEAGKKFLENSKKIVYEVENSIQQLGEEFSHVPKIIKIGISKSVSMAYLPGFFVPYRKISPHVGIEVSILSSSEILKQLDDRSLDIGLIGHLNRVPVSLKIVKGFKDEMVRISPADQEKTGLKLSWLLIAQKTETGNLISKRYKISQNIGIVEMDSFDLIVNLVSMGVGCSIVPRRALASFPRKHLLKIDAIKPALCRRFAVVTKKTKKLDDTVRQFIESMLFS